MQRFQLTVYSFQQGGSSSGIPPWGADSNSKPRYSEKITLHGQTSLGKDQIPEVPGGSLKPGRDSSTRGL
jgi:hypothetical protein